MTEKLNPDDFVISRKRKKYKFAKFHNAINCFEFEEWKAFQQTLTSTSSFRATVEQSVDSGQAKENLPKLGSSITVEIGAGTGFFSVELAKRHPERSFVAVDVKADRLQKGAYEALERGLRNVLFVRARADQIDQLFEPKSLQAIWLTFPDPFPRPRSERRRMTHAIYLEKYRTLLKSNGRFYLKHDNRDFFCWSLEQLVVENWQLKELTFDLHESELSEDYKIITTYEKRWLDEGRKTNLVSARPN